MVVVVVVVLPVHGCDGGVAVRGEMWCKGRNVVVVHVLLQLLQYLVEECSGIQRLLIGFAVLLL